MEFCVLHFTVNSVIYNDQYLTYSNSVLLSLIFLLAYPKTLLKSSSKGHYRVSGPSGYEVHHTHVDLYEVYHRFYFPSIQHFY